MTQAPCEDFFESVSDKDYNNNNNNNNDDNSDNNNNTCHYTNLIKKMIIANLCEEKREEFGSLEPGPSEFNICINGTVLPIGYFQ